MVDHVFLFTLGFVFYWVLPVALGVARLFETRPLMNQWYQIFDQIPINVLLIYMSCSLISYCSFFAGGLCGNRIFYQCAPKREEIVSINTKVVDFFLIGGVIAAGILAYILRDKFLKIYSSEPLSVWKGSFIASTVFLLSLAFIYSTEIQTVRRMTQGFWRAIYNRYFIVYAVFSLLLLFLGARTFMISSILMLLVYKTNYFKRINIVTFLLFTAGIAVLSTMLAFMRTGAPIDMLNQMGFEQIKNFIFIFFSDSLYTGFSLIDFLRGYELPLIKSPIFFLSEFVNLIPTFIYPLKRELIVHPDNYGYNIFNPNAALHAFFPLMVNFGVIGTIGVLFLLSFILGLLKNNKAQPSRTIYIMTSGWIAVSFFRDLEITLVKLIFEFSFLVPIIIIAVARIFPKKTEFNNADNCN